MDGYWHPFHKDIVTEMLHENGLLVLGKGLGIHQIIAYFLKMYSFEYDLKKRYLVFGLHMSEYSEMLLDALISLGVSNEYLPKVINNKVTASEREKMYQDGGCFLITSRIMVADLLNEKIDPKIISGFLINHAERVSDISNEAFIIHFFREKNFLGFVKAFCEHSVSISGGFNKTELILKVLCLKKLWIYPRFHASINQYLEQYQPQVIEIEQPLTSKMLKIQEAIMIAMESCLKELKSNSRVIDASDLTIENAFLKTLDISLRRQLDPIWHRLPLKTKQLVNDIGTLREILCNMTRYDAITFYSILEAYKVSSGKHPSHWLMTDAGDQIFKYAKSRLYTLHRQPQKDCITLKHVNEFLQSELEINPKWPLVYEILQEIQQEDELSCSILLVARDEETLSQLREYLYLGEERMMKQRMCRYITQKMNKLKFNHHQLSSDYQLLIQWKKIMQSNDSKVFNQEDLDGSKMINNSKKRKVTISSEKELIEVDRKESLVHTFALSMQELQEIQQEDKKRENLFTLKKKTIEKEENNSTIIKLEELNHSFHLIMSSYDQIMNQNVNILEELNPSVVIVYDPHMGFIRQLEVYNASIQQHLKIYFLMYENSWEQQVYFSELKKEKKAFEKLIETKSHLIIPRTEYDIPKQAPNNSTYTYSMDTRTSIISSTTTTSSSSSSSSIKQIVVDIRELRSALPFFLHQMNLKLHVVTLEIGDYILTPSICIERKSVNDLFSSFTSGRLYNQIEQMENFYKIPILLIEFTPDKSFSLQNISDIHPEISSSNICSKMVLLCLHFSKLRILWSRSPRATVKLFHGLKENQSEPNIKTAMDMGIITSNTSSNTNNEEQEHYHHNLSAEDLLLKLPGITCHNYRKIIQNVSNLAELCTLSLEQLISLIGTTQAKLLYSFLHHTI